MTGTSFISLKYHEFLVLAWPDGIEEDKEQLFTDIFDDIIVLPVMPKYIGMFPRGFNFFHVVVIIHQFQLLRNVETKVKSQENA